MRKIVKNFLASLAVVAGFGIVMVSTPAFALDPLAGACDGSNAGSSVCADRDDNVQDVIRTVINVLLYIVGIISVIVIIISGIMYTVSNGDSATVTKAKNALLYAIIGLVVAFLAYAIVNFVVLRFN